MEFLRVQEQFQLPISITLSLSCPLSPLGSRFIRFLSHRMENGDVVRKAFSVARARSLCTPRAFASFINRLLCCPISKLNRLLTGDVKVAQMSSSSVPALTDRVTQPIHCDDEQHCVWWDGGGQHQKELQRLPVISFIKLGRRTR